MFSGVRLSKSVTTTRQIRVYPLQIETNQTTTKVPVPFVVVFNKKDAAPIKRGGIKQVYF